MTIESLAADIVSRLPAMVKDTAINNEALVARLINDWCALRVQQHWGALKKPEPRLRPWKPEEVPVGALYKWSGHVSVILSFSKNKVFYLKETGDIGWNYLDCGCLEPHCFHSTDGGKTWKPCGVEESV